MFPDNTERRHESLFYCKTTGSRNRYDQARLFRTCLCRHGAKLVQPATATIKLDSSERDRIASLASIMKRTPHYLMKEAILEYVKREEAR